MEHLLDLMTHRVVILEIEGGEGADLDPAVPFDLGDMATPFASDRCVFGEWQYHLPGQLPAYCEPICRS
jgi:hypothetical protein